MALSMSRASFWTLTRSPETSGRAACASWTGAGVGPPAAAIPSVAVAVTVIPTRHKTETAILRIGSPPQPSMFGVPCEIAIRG